MRFTTPLSRALLAAALASAASLSAAADAPLQAGHEYLAVTNYPNNLTVIDTGTDSIAKTCTLPDAFGPGTIEISPDHTRAYVLNNHYGDLYGIDLDSCKTVFHADLAEAGRLAEAHRLEQHVERVEDVAPVDPVAQRGR